MVPEDRKIAPSSDSGGGGGGGGFFYGLATRVVSSVATAIDAVDKSLTSPPPPTSAGGAPHRRQRGDDGGHRSSSLLVPRRGRMARMAAAAGEVSGDESADEYVLVPSASCESLASQVSMESTATFESLKESSSGSDADDELVLVSTDTPKDVFSDDDTTFFDDSDLDTAKSSPPRTPLTRQNVQKLQNSATASHQRHSQASPTTTTTASPSSANTPTQASSPPRSAAGTGLGLQVCDAPELAASTGTQISDFQKERDVIETLSADAGAQEEARHSQVDRQEGGEENDQEQEQQSDEEAEEDAPELHTEESFSADLFSGVSSFFSQSFHGLQKVASTVTDVAEHALDTAVDASTGLYADGVALTGEIMNETVAVGKTIVNSSIDTIEDVLDTIVAPVNNRPPAVKTREQMSQQLVAADKEAGESDVNVSQRARNEERVEFQVLHLQQLTVAGKEAGESESAGDSAGETTTMTAAQAAAIGTGVVADEATAHKGN